MRKIFLPAVTLIICFSPSAVKAENAYLTAIPDIPLMQGLNEKEGVEAPLVFDKAEGRVIEEAAVINAQLDKKEVLDFYRATLPSLGWKATMDGENTQRFVRNKEQLIVKVEQIGTANAVAQFSLSPLR